MTLTCDRESLTMYVEGVLLDRGRDYLRVCDEVDVERAITALDKGEQVALIEGGRIVSYVVLRDGAYVEEESE